MKNLIAELRWRGHLQDMTAGTEEALLEKQMTGYVGFDPTAASLHIGNLASLMLLVHLQRAGHRPIAVVGGATGMVGDPSGKSAERNLLDKETLQHNQRGIEKQLRHFLDFEDPKAGAKLVNNYDWFKDISFLDFLRDVGKHLTVNYMMSKDSVQSRLANGLSFTEFSYQLLQAYDFYHLYTTEGCSLQMGGSDQFGNITAGTELIRRMAGGSAFGLVGVLVTKADGTKFGKSEGGNIWLDPEMTSPYKFYQFWLNVADEDVPKLIKIFSLKDEATINGLLAESAANPGARAAQKALAEEMTLRVHGQAALDKALQASQALFGEATIETLNSFSPKEFFEIFEGVPSATLSRETLTAGYKIIDLLAESGASPSKSEARKSVKAGAVRINKVKVADENRLVSAEDLLNNAYCLLQTGKKAYFIAKFE